jgi:predicted naringenin-chalcone synthase
MSLVIVGLGTALPATRIDQNIALKIAQKICCRTSDQAELLPALYRQSGITARHMVFSKELIEDVLGGTRDSRSIFLPGQDSDHPGPTTAQRMEHYIAEAGPLALRAAQQALTESGRVSRAISHLVTVSCTGFAAPGVDAELIKHLNLPPTIQRTHIGFMGCHGAINGLRVAQAFADARPGTVVLLGAVELCSLHYHYTWEPKKMVSNALFADGAAALVGVAGQAPSADAWQLVDTGSCWFPDTEYAMTWNIGDHGFDMTLSTRIPDLIARHLANWLKKWLEQHDLRLDQVSSWAVHPGGPRVLSAVEEALGLDRQATAASREVLATHGNMSSPTVLFILDELRRRRAPRPCVALGFGPGLVAEAGLFH